jgi:hypothetical protein
MKKLQNKNAMAYWITRAHTVVVKMGLVFGGLYRVDVSLVLSAHASFSSP